MGLNYRILSDKKNIVLNSDYEGNDKVQCVDLLSTSFNKYHTDLYKPVVVERDYIARPDLISLAIYGTDKYADVICKLNGISNPFELNENTVLYCPLPNAINNFFTTAEDLVDVIYDNDETIGKRLSTTQKTKNSEHNAFEQTIGTQNYVIDRIHNLIYY